MSVKCFALLFSPLLLLLILFLMYFVSCPLPACPLLQLCL